jgi:aminoglycoside 2'-N-acetyltransferase I
MLANVRALLAEVFGARFTEQDWQNACGGLHALVSVGGELVGHGSIVPRRFLYRDRTLRTGYVEAVAVRPGWRWQGHGAALMGQLENVLRASYDLGALSSSVEAESFYASRAWTAWQGPVSVLAPHGVEETKLERELYVFVPPADSIDISDRLTCGWREGDLW